MMPYYEHAGITIYHGDCREIMPTLPPSVSAVVTDPPYAISAAGSVHVGRPGQGSRRLDFFTGDSDWPMMIATVREAMAMARTRLAPEGSLYVWTGHRLMGPLVEDLEASGLTTRFLVWVKPYPPPAPPGAGWPSGAELCLYAYPAGRTWTLAGKDAPRSNVFVADSYRHGQPGKVDHPTQKPAQVIRPLVMASTRQGEIVLDPFAGSGTTLVVAKAAGRCAIGIEIEERYCEIAAKRLSQEILPFGEGD